MWELITLSIILLVSPLPLFPPTKEKGDAAYYYQKYWITRTVHLPNSLQLTSFLAQSVRVKLDLPQAALLCIFCWKISVRYLTKDVLMMG